MRTSRRNARRRAFAVAAAALVVLLLAGCGGGASRSNASPNYRTVALPSAAPDNAGAPGKRRPGYSDTNPPPVVDHGPRTGNAVALTFDADMTTSMAARLHANPNVSYANLAVITTLEQRRIPATFFITGMWAQEYPEVMARLAANPDLEFGNHTWSHRAVTANCYGLPHMTPSELTDEVARTFAAIRPYGGRQTNYFRFPGLCHDSAALAALVPNHVTIIDGDVVSGDPGATAAEPIVSAVLRRVQPGSIVILHVTEDNARFTDEALPAILDGLAEKGLRPVRLSVLLGQSD
jgi:hypothetical protein